MRRILCILLVLFLLPLQGMAAEEEMPGVNESFNGFATNEQPDTLNVSGGNTSWYIEKYAENDKGILIPLLPSDTNLTFETQAEGDYVISFDFASLGGSFNGSVEAYDNSDVVFTPLTLGTNNGIFAQRNLRVGGFATSKDKIKLQNISVAVHPDSGRYDIYTDGKKRLSDWQIEKTVDGISKVVFTFMALSEDACVLIDNINVHLGTKPANEYNVDEINPEEMEPVEKQVLESAEQILFYENFEGEVPSGMAIYTEGNKGQIERDENGGHLHIQRVTGNTKSFYYNIFHNPEARFYPSVVMEMDMLISSSTTSQAFSFRDANAGFSVNGSLSGTSFVMGSKSVADLGIDEWHKISVVSDFMSKTMNVYVDGALKAKEVLFSNMLVGPPIHVRFTVPASSPVDYKIDNILFYEGTEPKTFTLEEIEEKIGKSNSTSVLPDDSGVENILKNFSTLHLQSGVFYHNGTKSILQNQPYTKNGVVMVPVREISEKFGMDVGYDAQTSTISVGNFSFAANDKKIKTASGEAFFEEVPEIIDGCTYAPFKSFVTSVLGKEVFCDDTCINAGLAVIGDEKFSCDEGILQEVNDFALFYRPKREEILDRFYALNASDSHPRIFARKSDILDLRERLKSDVQLQKWLQNAEALSSSDIAAAAICYQLTGDTTYSQIAFDGAMSAINSGKWADIQYLSVGQWSLIIGFVYDWIYEALTPEQRKELEEGLYKQTLDDVIKWYKGQTGDASKFIICPTNWNEVCNGGIAISALALMDVYPELSSELLEYFVRAIEYPIGDAFAHDGASFESPSYYNYGKGYLYSMLNAMETVLGTEFNITRLHGFDRTLEYIVNMHTQSGSVYAYGDNSADKNINPVELWLASKTNKPDEAAAMYYFMDKQGIIASPSGMETCYLMLNYEDRLKDYNFDMPLDTFYKSAEVGVMRRSYTEPDTAYVGFKGGDSVMIQSHKHMDSGSFMFEHIGEKWALDMGAESYSAYSGTKLPSIWDMKTGRWYALRNRATGHSTVVINPVDVYPVDHRPEEDAKIIRTETKPKGAIGIVDMSKVLKKSAKEAKRGFFFTDDRQSLVVRDEITLRDVSDVYWMMYTTADDVIMLNKNTALLCKNGKTMRFEFSANAKFELVFEKAEPLDGTPGLLAGENRNNGISRLMLKSKTKDKLNITVKMTPSYMQGSDLKQYNIPMDEWTVPDGELNANEAMSAPATLDMIYVDGKEIEGFDKDVYSYKLTAVNDVNVVTEITAKSDEFDVEVVRADSAFDTTKIIVKDKNNPNRLSVYIISYDVIEKVKQIYGFTTYQVRDVEVSDIPQEMNGPLNMLDNNIATRYAVSGKEHWVVFDLGKEVEIDTAFMSIHSGDARQQYFNIAVSKDGENYEYVIKDGISSGKTLDIENYSFDSVTARYVKLELNESNVSAWNSITEFAVGKKN